MHSLKSLKNPIFSPRLRKKREYVPFFMKSITFFKLEFVNYLQKDTICTTKSKKYIDLIGIMLYIQVTKTIEKG